MLELIIKAQDLYDENENRFYTIPESPVKLEHSLLAISKWESIWKTPFLKKDDKTKTQIISYTECMCLTENTPEKAFYGLTSEQFKEVADYINDPMTATTINRAHQKASSNSGELVTSELIYYWMNECNINKECETWHLNRLMRLIEITSIKRQPPKKMSRRDAAAQQRSLNAARCARLRSRG